MAFTQNEIEFFLKLPDFIAVGEADHTYVLAYSLTVHTEISQFSKCPKNQEFSPHFS